MIRPSLTPVKDYIYKALGHPGLALPGQVKNEKILRLYKKAVRDQWSFDERHPFPTNFRNIDINEWLGTTDEVRIAAAKSFSSFYYGELGAKLISAQLTVLAPTNESSKFLATQTMDEARHVEAFEAMIGFIHGSIYPANPFLNAFLSDIVRTQHFEDKLVGMNLLVEGLALSAFRMVIKELKTEKNISRAGYAIIGSPMEDIIRDESRHVGFGVVFLPEVLEGLSWRRKTVLRLRQLAWLALLYGSVKYHQADMEVMGLDYLQLLRELIEDHEKRVADCGGDALVSTERMKSIIPMMDKLVDSFKKRQFRNDI
jgi:hypothetical protein